MVETISRRVVRTLRQLEYLEAGLDDAVATGYEPLRENEPELARAMAASVKQRIALRAHPPVYGEGKSDEILPQLVQAVQELRARS